MEAIISSLLTICARGYWTVEDMKALPFYLSVPVHEALRLRDLDLSRKLQHREEKQEEGEYLQYLLLSGKDKMQFMSFVLRFIATDSSHCFCLM